ncbi:MAG: GDSL-type esterase/lipase family protein, partial [Kiritimatiellaeota bacterium]|nr:GDSL-type esterase/lipase family protein [Kiritimatiellota bacterium]
NAGISGQNTRQALKRIQKDVLDRKPTLVIAAFGMNDIRGTNPVPTQESYSNQTQIVKLCKGAGAEVVLCTPTSIYHGYPEWPFERLAPYAAIVQKVGAEEKAPVADMFRTFEDMRAKDPVAWMLTMSEWIHPDMNGHKVIAETVIRIITGKSISLADVPAPAPGIPFTLAKIAKGEPVKVVAMEPYDKMIAAALREINPQAQVEVAPWVVPPQSIAGIAASATKVRGQKPDLVIVAIPATANDPTEEWYIRHYSETYNGSISYEKRTFDCIGILSSVGTPQLGPVESHQQDLARAIIRGHDLDPIERKAGDTATPEQILQRWLHQQAVLKVLPPETAK